MIRQISFHTQEHHSFSENLIECFNILESHITENHLLGIIFFIDSHSDSNYFRMKEMIQQGMEQKEWPVPFNVQAQSINSRISVEIWLEDAAISTEYEVLNGVRYTRSTSALGKTIWGIGISSSIEGATLTDQIDFSFETMRQILANEQMSFADIVRQWNYIPSILNIQDLDGKSLQNYQIFNEIRQKYYGSVDFKEGYPSATGIGTRNGNFDLDFFAVKTSTSVQKVGLSNPKQYDAYKYDQEYLVGDTFSGQAKKTPLFERAKLVKSVSGTMVYISGTASIIGQETIGFGDASRQTEITINNMLELIPTNNNQTIQFTYLRAYIKEVGHFQSVRNVCEAKFPDVTVSYLQADVCRDSLLVEIEGAAILD